jgi:TonB family protein
MHRTLTFAATVLILVACGTQSPIGGASPASPNNVSTQGPKPQLLFSKCRNLPDYPSSSRQRGETGTVVLAFMVDANGQVTRSEVRHSSGYALLDQTAMNTLSQCPFQPAYRDGSPIASEAVVTYVWKLQ